MLWFFWILSILAVIGAKAYTTKTAIRTRFKLNELTKRVAKMRSEEKVARNNLEVTRRSLTQIQNNVALQRDAVEKLKETIAALDQEREKKLKEAKHKLMH